MLQFPYGISHFPTLRNEGFVYLDRTPSIPVLEQAGKQLLFLRPRRFGKSLLVSTLAHYYDINQTAQFAALFGDLAIGQNPTAEKNKYMVLQWDFSQISSLGTIEHIKQSLFAHLNEYIKTFAHYYASLLKVSITINPNDGIASFQALINAVKESGYQLYLLIDEYDNFANEVLMYNQGDKARYLALLEGEGILKTLFKVIKAGAAQGKIARVFITGVSPVIMSDMTSGYNVAKNISLDPRFNQLCGITTAELEPLVRKVLEDCKKTLFLTPILDTMRQFYNGYRFSYSLQQPLIYNPILSFYFLDYYQLHCTAPHTMLDANLAMDAGRIRYIANLEGGREVIDSIIDEQNPVELDTLADDFGVENIGRIKQDKRYMLSLMYYFGILTLGGIASDGSLILTIPNLVVRGLYLEQLKKQALPDSPSTEKAYQVAKQFYRTGDLAALVDFMEHKYFKVFSNRDYRWGNELTIKTAFASLLYNDLYYVMDSETALERRYSDLIMIVRSNMRQYPDLQDFVLEFKYLSLEDLKLTGTELKNKTTTELKALPQVQMALQGALEQLEHYQQVLTEKYQEPKRLHCLAIVSLGFERLVWCKLAAQEVRLSNYKGIQ
ncbi:MAG: AAA family ATPase [Thiofilum sp.]|nr:AAA family ATPase [Thiofilum sp.]